MSLMLVNNEWMDTEEVLPTGYDVKRDHGSLEWELRNQKMIDDACAGLTGLSRKRPLSPLFTEGELAARNTALRKRARSDAPPSPPAVNLSSTPADNVLSAVPAAEISAVAELSEDAEDTFGLDCGSQETDIATELFVAIDDLEGVTTALETERDCHNKLKAAYDEKKVELERAEKALIELAELKVTTTGYVMRLQQKGKELGLTTKALALAKKESEQMKKEIALLRADLSTAKEEATYYKYLAEGGDAVAAHDIPLKKRVFNDYKVFDKLGAKKDTSVRPWVYFIPAGMEVRPFLAWM